ncbi:MAG TPA: CHAT domain-containing tetratricopeptide repeat protein [Puia sp.]|nr:CHAT domain-containing tetratricopeptide repeat protein [Puia sp.]
MYRRLTGWISFLLLSFVVYGAPGTPPGSILALYHRSDALFHLSNATAASDSTALAGFEEVIRQVEKEGEFPGKDTLLFQSWLKKGVLLDSRANYAKAKAAYCRALGFPSPTDSSLFALYVYTGASYYNLNHFDSANYFLLKAEAMAAHPRGQDDQVRLYNTLGVLYYDNGNYLQGKNYFNRALGIVERKKPFDTAFAVDLQTNIATSYYHLEQYDEALAIYRKLLSYHVSSSNIFINMGNAYLGLNKYPEALGCFRKVDAVRIPAVLNEMGYTEMKLAKADSAAWFLDQLQTRLKSRTGSPDELDLGINARYRADLQAGQHDFMGALASLQKAIITFSRAFTETDIRKNPSNFTGTFAYYRLYDALVKKAEVFWDLYKTKPDDCWLEASFEAYQAALSLLRYIEKSYDTDDAKIFLKRKSGQAYDGALSVCLELRRRHPDGNYLEQAFAIIEKSKASIITANLEENTFAHAPGVDAGLLQTERNIKYNIARLNVKSEETTDKKELETLAGEKAAYEIQLSQVQKKLEQNGTYYRMKYQDNAPTPAQLQKQLEDDQALISFYAAAGVLHTFILTSSTFTYVRMDSLPRLREDAEQWVNALKTTENGRKFKAGALGHRLYSELIKPLQQAVPGKDEWIIIPDGFLYFLPFESLPAGEDEKTLLETTTISYRFSSRLLTSPTVEAASANILSFAPFASQGSEGAESFARLPASGEEIAGLPGAHYIDRQATKSLFLKEVNKYSIVHLATHAVSSLNNAAASFIAFYPVKHSPIEDCLFLEELYGLNLNATKLVIISACETGQGELVAKEGVISLSRAFAYAGCGSTINSLWKADDKATSFILQRFYVHLQKGETKAKALQQAKLDYLASDAINKSPAFWAHLVLMGDSSPLYKRKMGWLWVLLLIPLGLVMVWTGRRVTKRKKKSTSFKDGGI